MLPGMPRLFPAGIAPNERMPAPGRNVLKACASHQHLWGSTDDKLLSDRILSKVDFSIDQSQLIRVRKSLEFNIFLCHLAVIEQRGNPLD